VDAGEDARAGRWKGHDKLECGIHVQEDILVQEDIPVQEDILVLENEGAYRKTA
jgi:3'-phosphoadenosine 5'-phosphosulfate sulfotransferase (PAPS reductase)/FAD synthetase